MIVEPSSNHPISWPLVRRASHRMTRGPRYFREAARRRSESAGWPRGSSHGHERQQGAAAVEPRAHDGALVLDEEAVDAATVEGLVFPGVAGDVGDLLDAAVGRRVKR